MSLKSISYIEKHYETYTEDLLDFNNYALRKGAVNHNIQMLQLIKDMYSVKYAKKCCIMTIKNVFKILGLTKEEVEKL